MMAQLVIQEILALIIIRAMFGQTMIKVMFDQPFHPQPDHHQLLHQQPLNQPGDLALRLPHLALPVLLLRGKRIRIIGYQHLNISLIL